MVAIKTSVFDTPKLIQLKWYPLTWMTAYGFKRLACTKLSHLEGMLAWPNNHNFDDCQNAGLSSRFGAICSCLPFRRRQTKHIKYIVICNAGQGH